MRWRLWYGDNTSFGSEDGTWAQAPSEDVQALAVWNDHGPTLTYGVDTYRLPGQSAKHGRWMPDDEWEALRLRIHDEVS